MHACHTGGTRRCSRQHGPRGPRCCTGQLRAGRWFFAPGAQVLGRALPAPRGQSISLELCPWKRWALVAVFWGRGPTLPVLGAASHSWRCWGILGSWAPPRVRAPVPGPGWIKALARWRGDYAGVPRASFRQHHAATWGWVMFGTDPAPPQNHLGLPKSSGSLAVLGGMKTTLGAWGVPTPGGYPRGPRVAESILLSSCILTAPCFHWLEPAFRALLNSVRLCGFEASLIGFICHGEGL